MKHLPNMDQEPAEEIVGECGAMVKAARIAGFGKVKKLNYVKNMDREHLERARCNQNRIEGREEGRAEGKAEANRENARKMLAKGLSITDIAEITGLSAEEIQAL